MGPFSRKSLVPARAVVVPGTVDTAAEVASMLRSARGKITVRVGLVVDGETGMHVVAGSYPMWLIQIFKQAGVAEPPAYAPPQGYTIPVLRDAESGQVTTIDLDALVAELAPYQDAAKEAWRQEHGVLAPVRSIKPAAAGLTRSLRELVGDVGETVREITSENPPPSSPRPTAETHPPVQGVDYDHWIRSLVGLGRGGVTPDQKPAFLESLGFPLGAADAVDAEWYRRAKTDAVVADWFGYDYHHLDPG